MSQPVSGSPFKDFEYVKRVVSAHTGVGDRDYVPVPVVANDSQGVASVWGYRPQGVFETVTHVDLAALRGPASKRFVPVTTAIGSVGLVTVMRAEVAVGEGEDQDKDPLGLYGRTLQSLGRVIVPRTLMGTEWAAGLRQLARDDLSLLSGIRAPGGRLLEVYRYEELLEPLEPLATYDNPQSPLAAMKQRVTAELNS